MPGRPLGLLGGLGVRVSTPVAPQPPDGVRVSTPVAPQPRDPISSSVFWHIIFTLFSHYFHMISILCSHYCSHYFHIISTLFSHMKSSMKSGSTSNTYDSSKAVGYLFCEFAPLPVIWLGEFDDLLTVSCNLLGNFHKKYLPYCMEGVNFVKIT